MWRLASIFWPGNIYIVLSKMWLFRNYVPQTSLSPHTLDYICFIYFYPPFGGRADNTPRWINLEGNSCLTRNALGISPSSIRGRRMLKRFRNRWVFYLHRLCLAIGARVKDSRKSSEGTPFPLLFLNKATATDAFYISLQALENLQCFP